MPRSFADRLLAAVAEKDAAVCVGFDPILERLPQALQPGGRGAAEAAQAFFAFGRGVIEAASPHVPAIKINIAFFEPYFEEGLRVYHALVREAHAAGMVVIGDVKRADIGHTSGQYALAHLCGPGRDPAEIADAVTINPYFGSDGLGPFVDLAHESGRGVFVLVQTSNESASQVQNLVTRDGRTVAQHVAALVQKLGQAPHLVGRSGYSHVGAVVSPRDLESTDKIRELMPNCIFLVPGFGAQGMTAEDVARCFKRDGTGALITASRSVIFAFEKSEADWRGAVSEAAARFAAEIRAVAASRAR